MSELVGNRKISFLDLYLQLIPLVMQTTHWDLAHSDNDEVTLTWQNQLDVPVHSFFQVL